MADERRRGLPLGVKLALGLTAVAAATVLLLSWYLAPLTTTAFEARGEALIEQSSEALTDLAGSSAAASRQVLIDLIRHTTDARQRTLADMPLSLYAGDPERLRAAVRARDAQRSARQQANVDLLVREMERRSQRRIDAFVERLAADQQRTLDRFSRELRTASLLLTGAVFTLSLLVLGVGLFRVVVAPVQRLREASRAVAAGDLDVAVEVRSRDEIGGLAADFAAMVEQLRASRAEIRRKNAELTRWNEKLEDEVSRKTRHLERALAELRAAQRQLLHAAKMASVGTLAGGIAHEFNNLIGGIRGCAAEALVGETDAARREPLEVILRAATRGTEITDQLLRFARQRVGTLDEQDVGGILGDALRLVEPHVKRLGVAVETAFDGPLTAVVDGNALHQVFVNLLTNGLQAMPDGGRLVIRCHGTEDEVEITVTDTGHGMTQEIVDRVFEPFFTTKDREADPFRRGSGLGLAVSYGIVEAHGGSITVHSEVGHGATFTVRIPRRPPVERDS